MGRAGRRRNALSWNGATAAARALSPSARAEHADDHDDRDADVRAADAADGGSNTPVMPRQSCRHGHQAQPAAAAARCSIATTWG